MTLTILLPVLFTLSLFAIIYARLQCTGVFTKIRTAVIPTFLLTGVFIVIITEFLSAFSLLTFPALLITWSVVTIILLIFCFSRLNVLAVAKEVWQGINSAVRLHWFGWLILVFLSISFLIAILYPPNNYDFMTSHMAPVAHWVQ